MFRLIAIFALCAVAAVAADPTTTVTGKLVPDTKAPQLKAAGKSYRLVAADDYTGHVLHTTQLAGREVRLEGRWKDGNTFEVQRALTVREGRLYKVIWYCDTCAISSYRPGRCDCCQQPTELREVPFEPDGIR